MQTCRGTWAEARLATTSVYFRGELSLKLSDLEVTLPGGFYSIT